MASGVAHDLRTALAVQTAVSESGDAVRAQGLELYCVELQQRMKEMQEEAAEQEQLMDELHDMDWPRVVLQQKRTIRVLQEQTVSLKQEIEDERAGFARAMNKAMTTLNGDGKKKQGRGRSSGRDSRSKNAHNLQEFITDISRQVSRHREEVLEWQRRHKRSTRAWVELEQERDHLATELDRVHAHGIDQTRGWRDMVSARDRQIVRLEDQLSRLAGGSDDAKLAAAQVLVRKLHEMRREEEERMTARAEEMKKDVGSSIGATNRRANTTHVDVLQSRIVALQNELRQMQEEGGVSSTVAARQAARAAQQEVAAATLHAERLEMSVRQMKKNSP